MSLQKTVQAAVDRAFAAAGDLVVSATLNEKQTTGFDFSTGKPKTTGATTVVPAVVTSTRRRVDGGFKRVTQATLKTGSVKIDGFASITIDGVSYGFSVSDSNGYVTVVELT